MSLKFFIFPNVEKQSVTNSIEDTLTKLFFFFSILFARAVNEKPKHLLSSVYFYPGSITSERVNTKAHARNEFHLRLWLLFFLARNISRLVHPLLHPGD